MAESFFDRVHKQDTHVPDVLSCLSNLSNDEVFTPPEIVNQMLDMLPQELFASTETTFLDPACKTGVFLREIAKRLLNFQLPFYQDRMNVINEKKANNIQLSVDDEIFLEKLQKAIDHIFHKQLFGIAITELTSLLSRRSVYCSKYPNGPYSITQFDDAEGNIRYRRMKHSWDKKGRCVFCGTSAEGELGINKRGEELETHAYEFIHTLKPEEIWNMKFDVIISNPPYQLSDGGHGASAMPIYQKFVEQALKMNPRYLTMITPARWYAGGRGLDAFRASMLGNKHITKLHDFPSSSDCFPGVQIEGGVCFFLIDREKEGPCEIVTHNNQEVATTTRFLLEDGCDTFIRYDKQISILNKVKELNEDSFISCVKANDAFGFDVRQENSMYRVKPKYSLKPEKGTSKFYYYGWKKDGVGYFETSKIRKGTEYIDEWKVLISRAYGMGSTFPTQVINKPFIVEPNSCCTETYSVIGPFQSKEICDNVVSYITTRFFRFMVLLLKCTQSTPQKVYQFVPMQDFSKPWTDEELYKKYNLTQEEIDFIESMVRPMDLDGGEADG